MVQVKEQSSDNNSLSSLVVGGAVLAATMSFQTGCSGSHGEVLSERTSVKNFEDFKLDEISLTAGTDFEITVDGKSVGKVVETGYTSVAFNLEDNKGSVIASAKKRMMSLRTTIDFFDGDGSKIAQLEEKKLKSSIAKAFSFTGDTYYSLQDKHGREIGVSNKRDFLSGGSSFDILDVHGSRVARIERGATIRYHHWTVDGNGEFDSRVLALLPAFKSQNDLKDKSQDDLKE